MRRFIIFIVFYCLYVLVIYFVFNKKYIVYISGIQFFAQAPFWTKQDWNKNETSCEEATIWLYIWWLKNIKFTKQSFDTYLQNAKKFQILKYWKEIELSWQMMVDFINSYFSWVNAYLVENLTEEKISWFLKEKIPIIIWVYASDLANPYYHWRRYHTLLIVWENKDFYIVKDVWTKRWNNFFYLKSKILKALKRVWFWWVIIKRWGRTSFVNIFSWNKKWIYSSVMIKDFYDNLILDRHNWKKIYLPPHLKWWILSHHLLVAPLFDNYFRLLKEVKPNIKLFVIWWTNHFNFDNEIRTTNLNYVTPYWEIKVDANVKDLINKGILKLNNKLLKNEHSIFAITPFIKKYYPDAKILPFIINNEVSDEKLDRLEKALIPILLDSWTFYLQSTDFSHYVPDDFRKFYDMYSENALLDWDITRVKNMWVDSRKLMYLTFKLLWDLWYKKVYILFNTSSNEYLWVKNFQNTSYFFVYIWKWENFKKTDQVSILFWWDMILNFLSKIDKKCNLWTIMCFQNFWTWDKNESVEDYFFKWYDLIVFNMEWNFWDKTYEKNIIWWPIYFKYDKKYLKYLRNKLKVEVLFFSNNHQRDFWFTWIKQTYNLVKQSGLKYVWNAVWFNIKENVFIKQIWDRKLIIINLNDVVNPLQQKDLKQIENFIKKNKNSKTIIIIFIHWWREYFLESTKRQIELWHKFIDWGADLVVGSHTHTIQPMEIYKWKRIYYSLWNITYDNDRQKKVIPDIDYGLFVWVNFNNKGVYFFHQPYKIIHKKPIFLIWKTKDYILRKYWIIK